MNEEQKGRFEIEIFNRFSKLVKLDFNLSATKKSFPPKPDIYTEIQGQGVVWFELTEACAPEYKKAINSRSLKNLEIQGDDVSSQIVLRKITKSYPVKEPIELLVYTDEATSLTDQLLIKSIKSILKKGAGSFRRVWFMGEKVYQIWPFEVDENE